MCVRAFLLAPPAPPQEPGEVAIPFVLTAHNNLVVKATLNNADKFDLMFHSAASGVALTEDAVRRSTSLTFTDTSQVKSWGGEAGSRYSTGNRLRVGRLHRDSVKVWENKQSGVGTNEKFGLDFFQRRVVEIDRF